MYCVDLEVFGFLFILLCMLFVIELDWNFVLCKMNVKYDCLVVFGIMLMVEREEEEW